MHARGPIYILLSTKTSFNFCSLNTFPQVIARGTAVSAGDAPGQLPGSQKDAVKVLKHMQSEGYIEQFSWGALLIRFLLSLFLHGGFLRGFLSMSVLVTRSK